MQHNPLTSADFTKNTKTPNWTTWMQKGIYLLCHLIDWLLSVLLKKCTDKKAAVNEALNVEELVEQLSQYVELLSSYRIHNTNLHFFFFSQFIPNQNSFKNPAGHWNSGFILKEGGLNWIII